MTNVEIIMNKIVAGGFQITPRDDDDNGLLVRPASRLTDPYRDFIREHEPELISWLRDQQPQTPTEPIQRAKLRFKLIENQGGGTVLGAEGDTLRDVKADLLRRYGKRLAWMRE